MPRREFWGLDDSIGYLARIVFRRFTGAFEKRTLPHGISMGQYALLRSLWKADALTAQPQSGRPPLSCDRHLQGL